MENFNIKKDRDGDFGARANPAPKKVTGGAGPNKGKSDTPPAAPTSPATVQPAKNTDKG